MVTHWKCTVNLFCQSVEVNQWLIVISSSVNDSHFSATETVQ